ncbi:MAG: TonB-dependent receptor [Prevotella sp.]|nr:TonB-dependent receptor [Prevotella sp.]
MNRKLLSTLILFANLSTTAIAQNYVVKGHVQDKDGEPLIGVTVQVKGSKAGTVTDVDGNYSISVPNDKAILTYSYVGYSTVEQKIGTKSQLDIILQTSEEMIDQVVVIGYGTQKKVNLTGAVASVNVDQDLASRSVANISSALSGLMPGLTVTQTTGMAGNNNASLLIRGLGTINNSSPLIVVDDMPDVDINRVNINDIESISVLKDATAASVYGSRAANGVILIKTKSGSKDRKTQINFSASYGWQQATKSYDLLSDYAEALTLHQISAATNPGTNGVQQTFKDGTIDQWMALGMIDPIKYPNTDWFDYVMRTGNIQNYNVSATGGNDKSNFFASIGYMKQKGLQISNDYDRYNIRLNFDYLVLKNVQIGMKIDGNWSNYSYCQSNGFNGEDNRISTAIAGIYPYDPETGNYGGPMAYGELPEAFNPLAVYENSVKHENRQEFNGMAFISWKPFKGFTARLDYSLRYYNQYFKNAPYPTQSYNFQTDTYKDLWYVAQNSGVTDSNNNGYKTLMNARLNYETKFGKYHDLKLLGIYSEEYWYSRSNTTGRADRIHPSLSEINAALTTQQTTNGTSSRQGLRSWIGRMNYTAFDRYLLELNFRVDGSSKFLKGHRYGFFPSASVGWRISEEPWIKPHIENWLDNVKLRASYGQLGNNSGVGVYQQREIMTQNNYMFDGKIATGFTYQKMLNEDLTWEKTSVFNLGLDFDIFRSNLSVQIDYYDRLTTGMLQNSQMSILLTGAYEAPKANLGNLRNRGIEANIVWRNKIGKLNYSVSGNFSYNRMNLEKWGEFLDKGYVYLNMPYHFIYYMDALPYLAQTFQDTYNYADQGAKPGDIIRLDTNGDGILDANDKIAEAGSLRDSPTMNFALNVKASYQGFDFAMLWQGGAGHKDIWINKFNSTILPLQSYTSTTDHIEKPWSWENRGGEWPRLGGNATNATENAFYVRNMDYFRMKNIQIGYTLPRQISKKFYAENLRVYFSAENLLTITGYEGLDPEKPAGSGDLYPTTKTYTVGINLSF